MRLTLADPKYLKDSISIISDLVTEAKFTVKENGLELVAMDPANIAMVVFNLLSSTFIEYDVDQETELTIDLDRLRQVMRRANAKDTVTLENEEGQLNITFSSEERTRTFSIPIIELDEKDQNIPDLDFPLSINTQSSILKEAVKDVDVVAESVSLSLENNTFTIAAESDLGEVEVDIEGGEEDTTIESEIEEVTAKYSIEYLKKIVNAKKIADKVEIKFNNDYPLRLEYKEVDKVSLSFILAPRVENE